MTTEAIKQRLYELQDIPYRDFQAKLIPNISPESMIGTRTPALRKLAKELHKDPDIGVFLQDLPHTFFDENQLHAFLISEIKNGYLIFLNCSSPISNRGLLKMLMQH